jgi:hypothetical protein
MEQPNVIVEQDYDGVFEQRVQSAIKLNQDKGIGMKKTIVITSGPYRSYCMAFTKQENSVHLDFYSAGRVFGFEHTIEDIASVIGES